LQSQEAEEISREEDEKKYEEKLQRVVKLAVSAMKEGSGTACIVGKQYYFRGKIKRMDLLYTNLFIREGFRLVQILVSIPDVAVVLKRGE